MNLSYRDAYLAAGKRLEAAGEALSDTPYLDAALLLAHAADCSRTEVFIRFPEPIPEGQYEQFHQLLEKRLEGQPVSYLRGRKEFWGMDFLVSPAVLTPRPDTETIIEAALERSEQEAGPLSGEILDLCCGSGCIGISLASEFPECTPVLSDISPNALEICRKNIHRLLPGRKSEIIESNLFSSIDPSRSFSLIATNPPYLQEEEVDRMRENSWAEPELALRGGEDGLDLIRIIIKQAFAYLLPKSYLLIESSSSQCDAILTMMEAGGYEHCFIRRDLAGRKRITGGRRPGI